MRHSPREFVGSVELAATSRSMENSPVSLSKSSIKKSQKTNMRFETDESKKTAGANFDFDQFEFFQRENKW
jgi:hypothetical protein